MPKIALVCDWLTTPGGAEKVLLELHRLYPEAPIYTSQYRPKRINWFQDATVRTGWLNLFPAALRKVLGPLRQLYFSHLNLTDYDLVISVTGAEAKAVQARRHICYCHIPTQYYWGMYDEYLQNAGFGIFNPLVRLFLKLFIAPLRRADLAAAARPTQFVTISQYTAAQIKKYYHRDAIIIAPPVDTAQFSTRFPQEKPGFSTTFPQVFHKKAPSFPQDDPCFIIACRQVTWKRVDLAISACLKTQHRLLVIGDGPEHQKLLRLAAGSPLIEFHEWLPAADLAAYLQTASAYIFPSLEPFGIAAVEALAAGCPVIAYQAGGSRDIIEAGKNGLFFSRQTVSSLSKALQDFTKTTFKRSVVQKSAAQFDCQCFDAKIRQLVKRMSL